MRRMGLLLILGVMASLVVWASPAHAKCFGVREVVLEGPGLAGPLVLESDEWGVPRNERSPQARAIEGLFTAAPSSVPLRSLGPGFRLTYALEVSDFETGGTRVERIQQKLYPYARLEEGPRGAFTFTPAQTWRSCTGEHEQIPSGWRRFPAELARTLRRNGLPPPGAVPQPRDPAAASRPAVVIGAGIAVAIGAGIAVAIGAMRLGAIRSRGRAGRARRSR